MNNMIKFLTNKFKTRCPYKIANEKAILIIHEPLGNIYGYYNKINEQKFIHVNSDLNNWCSSFVVAYQLYNALNNKEYQFFIKGKCNYNSEAFHFAVALLCNDSCKTNPEQSLVMA